MCKKKQMIHPYVYSPCSLTRHIFQELEEMIPLTEIDLDDDSFSDAEDENENSGKIQIFVHRLAFAECIASPTS
jgi:hypothetical protein